MNDEPLLTVITISYNSQNILTERLGPLIRSAIFPVIIIDNASTDNSADILKKRFKKSNIKKLPQNIGYGRAANVAFKTVNTPYALLLNPDVNASLDDVTKLLEIALKDTSATAIWGPATKKKDITGSAPHTIDWLSGSAMLFDMNKLKRIGLFDNSFFLFYEETDLCMRARAKGYNIKLCGDLYFEHTIGQSSAPSPSLAWMKDWHYGWSRCYYTCKHSNLSDKSIARKQYLRFLRKFYTSIGRKKRFKFKARAAGAKAYLMGEQAFLPSGDAQMTQQNSSLMPDG